VIIFRIDVDGVLAIETECDPPIATYIDCVPPFLPPLQGMKSQPRDVHVLRGFGSVERQ